MIDWSDIPERLKEIDNQSSEPIDQEALHNTAHFVFAAGKTIRPPDALERGYFPTLCFFWEIDTNNSIEVEVFSTSYEVYHEKDSVMTIREFSAEGSDNIFPEFSEMMTYLTSVLNP